MLDKIHWRPSIRWVVQSINILAPIEVEEVIDAEAGCRHVVLKNVDYLVFANFVMTQAAEPHETRGEHYGMFRRRLAKADQKGLFLGRPSFPAIVTRFREGDVLPVDPSLNGSIDFGWYPTDPPYNQERQRFFRAVACDGVVHVPAEDDPAVYG